MATVPVKEETFDSTGGVKIFLRSWRPEGAPKAVLVMCHGVNSHGGQYDWPARQFARRPSRRKPVHSTGAFGQRVGAWFVR